MGAVNLEVGLWERKMSWQAHGGNNWDTAEARLARGP